MLDQNQALQVRLTALQLANNTLHAPHEVVERANAYASFILGGLDAGEDKPLEEKTSGAVEPGVKRRGRPAKEKETVEPEKLEASPPAAIDYKEVQLAVVTLVRSKENGKELALGILEQFGVATALDLKPEQYAEALRLFQEAAL